MMDQMFLLLSGEAATTGGTGGLGGNIFLTLGMLVITVVFFWLFLVRPQKKEEKRVSAMQSSMEVGDSVITTGGFYGVIIDVTDEDVIVEFGSNKNCRIPMKKAAIAQLEKANSDNS